MAESSKKTTKRKSQKPPGEGETNLRFTGKFQSVPGLTPEHLEKYDGCGVQVIGFIVCHETEHQETLVKVRFLSASAKPFEHDVFLDEITENAS